MVSVGLRMNPEAVAAAGSALAGVAQRMADDVAALETTVLGPGNPWGGDESGTAFAVAYQAVLGHALTALGSYVHQVGEAALILATQARSVAATDAEAASSLRASAAVPSPAGPSAAVSSPAGPFSAASSSAEGGT